MSHTAALMGLQLGEARRRETRAKERRERNQVSPEVRAERARILEERDARTNEAEAKAQAEQQARPTALEAVLNRATVDELAELSRSISRFDGRRLQQMVDDAFRVKACSGYQPDDGASQEPQETAQAAKVSSSSRIR
ncbi:hypothetical protein FV242_08315 [Methylobacterium sp. WL64]|uniref:hypothetical protein n=1 Tax=Methylobacterium sp. WL64 TaxID=2603894 RepID=UPI0011C9AAC2|nr:hypothetical protein [Methylobacterium sp. WL64]TXN04209.1 hypothetical protein FV242_08315 [Methylobacterium sp. WL64]